MSTPRRDKNMCSDTTLAHIFLYIDSSDDRTLTEIMETVERSKAQVLNGVQELQRMGCVKREIDGVYSKRYLYFSTGHDCVYCTSKIEGL